MGYSQQSVYNIALRWLEERPVALNLGGLTEQREPVRLLNAEWTNAVATCLYAGYWNFAVREVQATPDINRSPQFGFSFCYQKPTDWVRTFQMSANEQFDPLLRFFKDQNAVWYANVPLIYVKYISNDPNFGWNLGYWTPGFAEYLGGYLAYYARPGSSKLPIRSIRSRNASSDSRPARLQAMRWTSLPGRCPMIRG